nr:flavodoxin [uncultured Anaerostipes sp.]
MYQFGHAIWWGIAAWPVNGFVENNDFTGKRIIPFCTNEGSGMGGSERDLKKICKGAKVEKGLSIHGAEAAQSRSKVEAWVRKMV